MAEKINTSLEFDKAVPPEYEYTKFTYVTLPPGYGKIVCDEHRWMEGSDWGIALGDYNRGEVIGERITLEARTSEKNDTEDLEVNGERTIFARLIPGPSFDDNTKVKLLVKHTLQGSIKVQAMSNAEKNPPAIAATANYTWKQFDETDLTISVKLEGDKQTVKSIRKVTGTSSKNASVKIKSDGSGMPDINVDAGVKKDIKEDSTQETKRTSVSGVNVHQIISQVTDFDILTKDNPRSKTFQIFSPAVVSANVGDTDGFADASLNMNHSWIFDYELIKPTSEPTDSSTSGEETDNLDDDSAEETRKKINKLRDAARELEKNLKLKEIRKNE